MGTIKLKDWTDTQPDLSPLNLIPIFCDPLLQTEKAADGNNSNNIVCLRGGVERLRGPNLSPFSEVNHFVACCRVENRENRNLVTVSHIRGIFVIFEVFALCIISLLLFNDGSSDTFKKL